MILYTHDITLLCSYAPTNVVAALYGSVAGAQYSDSLGKWIVPCNAEVDASITIR